MEQPSAHSEEISKSEDMEINSKMEEQTGTLECAPGLDNKKEQIHSDPDKSKRSSNRDRRKSHSLHSHRSRSRDRHSSKRSRHRSHSSSHRRSSHRRRRSKSPISSVPKEKNTLLDVIKSAKESLISSRKRTVPDFDMIEPRYAYGKDLYVGNIEEGTFPEDVIAFLNRAMHTAHLNLWPGNPVLSCRVLPKFCFVSLRHEDEATAALNMDGIYFHGQRLRINRPVDYGGPQTDHRQWQEICPDASWADMYEVTGTDYRWVLKELETIPQEILNMCVEMDEKSLTPYLEITNLITSLDLESIDNFTGLIDEFREEFCRYGEVKNVLIAPKESMNAGKVFVEFANVEEAIKAYNSLWYRMFDNRLLGIAFCSNAQWKKIIET